MKRYFLKQNIFLLAGKVGDWIDTLSEKDNQNLNRMIALNLRDTGLYFTYELPEQTSKS